MKVVVDSERCTGHGRCYSLAQEVFDADEEGHSFVRDTELPEELKARAQVGVDNCPEGAISIVDG
jgi:ferredoxin